MKTRGLFVEGSREGWDKCLKMMPPHLFVLQDNPLGILTNEPQLPEQYDLLAQYLKETQVGLICSSESYITALAYDSAPTVQ
jgi:hypothetical protein